MGCRSICFSINTRITIASIGVAVGILAGVWFMGEFHSFNSGIFALVSAIFAALTLYVHIKYKRDSLRQWSSKTLLALMILGCFGQLAGVAAFITYLTLAIVKKQDLHDVHGEIYWVSLVWAWMTWKWGFALFWFCRRYKRQYAHEKAELQAEAAIEAAKIDIVQKSPVLSKVYCVTTRVGEING